MTTLTPDAAAAVAAAPAGSKVRLLITCDDPSSTVVGELRSGGVAVVQSIDEFGVVIVDALQSDLAALDGLGGVSSIELDREERALG